jgi:hypothetical protein
MSRGSDAPAGGSDGGGDEGCDGYGPGELLCAITAGAVGDQLPKALAVDPLTGAIFITGTFDASAEFGNDALVTVGLNDVFLARFTTDCISEWAVQFGGQGSDGVSSVAIDEDGNVIVAGSTTGAINFEGGLVETPVYVAKFDGSTGKNLWATGCAAGQGTTITDLAVGSSGEVAVTGQYFGTLNCGDGPHGANAMGDAFICKFDGGAGATEWSHAFAGAATESGKTVAFDPVGSVLVAGEFSGSLDVGGSNLESTDFFLDIFVAKFAANGMHVWSNRFGGTGVQRPTALGVDKLGSIFVGGWFEDILDLDEAGTFAALGNFDGFVFKLTPNGIPEWGTSFGDNDMSMVTDLGVDSDGNVLLVGSFEGTVDLGGEQLLSLGSFTVPDGVIAKLSGVEGTHVWSSTFGDYDDDGPWVSVEAGDNAVLCASGNAPLDFGSGMLSPTGADVFIARFAP